MEDEYKLKKYTELIGREYLSTPFSKKDVDRLIKLKVKALKIGSGECNNYPLIEYICKFKKPVILSTGMNSLLEITKAVSILKKNKITFALNHCTNIYPADYNDARLNFINVLKKKFQNTLIGLSDHSKDNLIALASIPMGVNLIERHYVDSKKRKGPDISSSMDFNELKDLIKKTKNIFDALNDKKKF
jgi:N-acetylneuraminate synthase